MSVAIRDCRKYFLNNAHLKMVHTLNRTSQKKQLYMKKKISFTLARVHALEVPGGEGVQ